MRKQYFIKRSFQSRFFIIFVLLLAVEAALITALFMYISRATITTGYSGSTFVIDKTSSFFLVNFLIMSGIIGIAVGLIGILLFIFLTHRIAGPLYRFEKSLGSLAEGVVSEKIRLRKTDQLAELQGALNLALERMDKKLKEAKKDVNHACDLAGRQEGKLFDSVKDALSKARESLDFFKTS